MFAARLLICLSLLIATLAAYAFDRPFPPDTKHGTMSLEQYPVVVIDGQTYVPTPGLKVWSQKNTTKPLGAFLGGRYVINYTLDHNGRLDRVWILTAQEARKTLPKPREKLHN